MHAGRLLFSIISLVFTLLILALGVLAILIAWAPEFSNLIIQFLEEETLLLAWSGGTLIAIGIFLAVSLYMMNRRRYYHIRMGDLAAKVDEAVVDKYVSTYWKELFPGQEVACEVVVRKNRIEIIADLPHVPVDQQHDMAIRIEKDLKELFAQVLEYRNPFLFNVSFA